MAAAIFRDELIRLIFRFELMHVIKDLSAAGINRKNKPAMPWAKIASCICSTLTSNTNGFGTHFPWLLFQHAHWGFSQYRLTIDSTLPTSMNPNLRP